MRTIPLFQAVGHSVSDKFGYWFAGLTDGEGSFNILANHTAPYCCFHIGLRADDRAVLERIHQTLGIGRLHNESRRFRDPNRDNKPSCRWVVGRTAECLYLVEIFRRYPLQTKKAADFEIWAEAVGYMDEHMHGSRWGTNPAKKVRDRKVLDLKAVLEAQRRFPE